MTKPTLLIMAAGMGSRYGGLKQIDPVGPSGEIVLDYSIHDAVKAGFDKVVFVIRRDIESEFRKAVGANYESKLDVHYAFQDVDDVPSWFTIPKGREKPWGTAHAILAARDLIRTPFAALNADDFYGQHSFQVLGRELERAQDVNGIGNYSMVGFFLNNTLSNFGTVSRGICTADADMALQTVVEHTAIEDRQGSVINTDDTGLETVLTGQELVSMNMWGFTPSFFDEAGSYFEHFLRSRGGEEKSECYIPAAVDQLIQDGKASCTILPTDSAWFGVTYQEDKPYVRESLQALADQGVYTSPLWT